MAITGKFNLPLLGTITNEEPRKPLATSAPDIGSLLNQSLEAVSDTPNKTTLSNMESGHSSLETAASPTAGTGLPQLNWGLIALVGIGSLVLLWILRR